MTAGGYARAPCPVDAPFALANVGAGQLALVGVDALAASILGGLAGYGTGLVLPAFIAPLVGVANVVPVMALGMAINNGARVVAFWRDIQWPQVRRVLLLGLPACALSAWGYTLLETRTIASPIGIVLVGDPMPLRRLLRKSERRLGAAGVTAAGAVFGVINGGMTGAGLLLISLLMAAGVHGAALIATDAIVSLVMGAAKIAIFGSLARLDAQLALAGLLIGACTAPGAFVARWLLARIPAHIHTMFMEAVVMAGGLGFLWRWWRG